MAFITIDPTATTPQMRALAAKYIGKYLGLGRDATGAEIGALVVTLLTKIVESEQATEQRTTLPPVTPFAP